MWPKKELFLVRPMQEIPNGQDGPCPIGYQIRTQDLPHLAHLQIQPYNNSKYKTKLILCADTYMCGDIL